MGDATVGNNLEGASSPHGLGSLLRLCEVFLTLLGWEWSKKMILQAHVTVWGVTAPCTTHGKRIVRAAINTPRLPILAVPRNTCRRLHHTSASIILLKLVICMHIFSVSWNGILHWATSCKQALRHSCSKDTGRTPNLTPRMITKRAPPEDDLLRRSGYIVRWNKLESTIFIDTSHSGFGPHGR